MKRVKVKDKEFVLSIDAETIRKRIAELAAQIEKDLNGEIEGADCGGGSGDEAGAGVEVQAVGQAGQLQGLTPEAVLQALGLA